MNLKEQGSNAGTIFHGKVVCEAARLVYGESAPLFAKILQSNIAPGEYVIADLGSHKGEFLHDLISLLPEYKFKTIAVDVNGDDLENNGADQKVCSDLASTTLADKSVDITIARYALAWNSLEKQREILQEVQRITRKIAIIQHQGADPVNPAILHSSSNQLFSGEIPELKRGEFFFSTAEQLEQFMSELGINFERIQNRKVDELSCIFTEKYDLSDDQDQRVREILSSADYIIQTAWILRF